jgi:parallel beta-helix repeat protein
MKSLLVEKGERKLERRVFSVTLLIILIISLSTLAFRIQPVRATGTIYIRPDGSVDPDTAPISSVDNITYTLTDNIVGDVPVGASAIIVEKDNIVVDGAGYILQGTEAQFSIGINLTGRSNVTIESMEIKAFETGIFLISSSDNTIYRNDLTNNNCGIELWGGESSNNTINQNNITNNSDGIRFSVSSNNRICGNNITNNVYYGILISHSYNNTFFGNNITKNYRGIYLSYESSNNTVSGNTIANNKRGTDLVGCSHNTLARNNITNNREGIQLWDSSYNTIFGNSITKCNVSGITVDYSINNNVSANNITENNMLGIWFSKSFNNTISRNIIARNNDGLKFISSYNNSIFENEIMINDYSGIRLENSSNNFIYHNSFIDNAVQVHFASSNNANIWDNGYPSGGNYWSDYKQRYPDGKELDKSGIWDIPYIINEENQDRYPLMSPLGEDFWPPIVSIASPENKTYPINDVSLVFTLDEPTSWIGYSLNAQMNLTVTGNTTIGNLPDKSYTIIVYANDTTGNMGMSEIVYFAIDTAPPSISIMAPENKTYDTTDIPLTFTIDEQVLWMAYSLDGQANVTITGNTTLSDLPDGLRSVMVYASDTAGNTGISEIIYFTIETKKEEAFPTWIIAPIVIIAVVGAVVFVYFTKFKK